MDTHVKNLQTREKSNTKSNTWIKYLTGCLIIGILLVALFIRLQGAKTLPPGLFRGPDAYHYYWLAHLISEEGPLPDRDMHRWLPVGRDLTQTLNLYSYALAYTHKAIRWGFPNITLYHVTIYAPVFCFCIGFGALILFLYRTKGGLFTIAVTILIATLPGTIERSTVGFSDRDSWCLMLGILAVVTYLAALQAETSCKQLFWTLSSGLSVFLGGLSWEGFGVFLSVILIVELWRFLTSETEDGFRHYILWVCSFVPTLYFASPAYRNGYGFAEHLAAFVLIPPLVLLAMRAIRILLLLKVDRLRPHARTLSLGLTLTSATLAAGYLFTQLGTFTDTTVPFSQNQLMQSVEELRAPDLFFWLSRYGGIFLFGGFGLILLHIQWLEKYSKVLAISPALFVITILFRDRLETSLGTPEHGHLLFFFSCLFYLIIFLFIAYTRKAPIENETLKVAILAWFCLWSALARGAARYDFFMGTALAFFTTEMVIHIAQNISENIPWKQKPLKTGLTVLALAVLIVFEPLGGHGTRTLYASTHLQRTFPHPPAVVDAIRWMKTHLKSEAIVAANWSYGSTLNVLGGVKTIIDQDHYIQHWIHLYHKHIYNATSEREALEYLKTHGVTHILLTKNDPQISFLRGQLSDAFVPAYPREQFTEANVNVWEIHYPPDIKTDPKYLKTGIPEIDAHLPQLSP